MTPNRLSGLLLITLVAACHPGADMHRRASALRVGWMSPDSSPQLQARDTNLPPVPTCGSHEVVIDADSVGPLRIGQRLLSILAICPHPLVGWEWDGEGIADPALTVRFGSGTVLITLTDTSDTAAIYYLSTTDSTLQTSDGVHVGMSVGDLRSRLGPLEFVEGEGGLYAYTKRRPNLGIQLTVPDSTGIKPLAPSHSSKVEKIFLHSAT